MSNTCLRSSQQYLLDVALRPFATFETFINPGDNELLSLLKDLVHPMSEPRQYFVWGAAQTGKTHLLQAICNLLADTKRKALYFSFKELDDITPDALLDLHHLDVVCLDDVDEVLGSHEWDQALFQLINELRIDNKSLVMASTVNPNDTILTLLDLASRLLWGPVYKLNSLTDQQKELALRRHANARGFGISEEVCSYLLKHYPRDLAKLIELLGQLDEQSLAQQRKVTIPFLKSVLNAPELLSN